MEDEKIVPPVTTDEPAPEPAVETPQDPAPAAEEPITLSPEEQAQLVATNKKLFERAKKAEEALRAAKAASSPATVPAPASSQPNVEEVVLLAQGLPEELLGELKAVASVRKVSLIKAQNDPIFVAVKEKFEKDKKQKESAMPASRGSGSVKPTKTVSTPGLTRDEHKALFQKAI